jgi:hypothetical protein
LVAAIAKDLGYKDFKASNGWLESLRRPFPDIRRKLFQAFDALRGGDFAEHLRSRLNGRLEVIMHAPANVLDPHFLVNRLICFLWDSGCSVGKVTAIKRNRAFGNNHEVVGVYHAFTSLRSADAWLEKELLGRPAGFSTEESNVHRLLTHAMGVDYQAMFEGDVR